MHVQATAKNAQSIEIKMFRYYVANRTAAEIEILCFADGKFAGQGVINFCENEPFASSSVYNTLDETLQNCYEIIESKIKDHEWVKSARKNLNF